MKIINGYDLLKVFYVNIKFLILLIFLVIIVLIFIIYDIIRLND